ncbi:putative reverse transcriptase zinc-binding domain-containing protein [Arabidopsis thaliana]
MLCLPKIKLFLWKSLNGAFPAGDQLAIRLPTFDVSCIRCNAQESICHILFTCPFVQRVWQLTPIEGMTVFPVFTDVSTWLSWLKKKKTHPPVGLWHCALYPWICWVLWISRNQKMFNNIPFSEQETVLKAILDAKDWQAAQDPICLVGRKPNPERVCPSPSPDVVVIHSDAAWNETTKVAGLG